MMTLWDKTTCPTLRFRVLPPVRRGQGGAGRGCHGGFASQTFDDAFRGLHFSIISDFPK